MKSILHVIDSVESGGAETVFVQIAHGMHSAGYPSVVVLNGRGWVDTELRRLGMEPIVIESRGSFDLSLLRQIVALVVAKRVDVIHSHLLGSNVYCAMAGLLTRKPVIATFHGMVDIGTDERLRGLKQWVMRRGVSNFVTVSQTLRDRIVATGWLTRERTTVIYNGADAARYGKSSRRDLRERLGVGDDALLIGSLGNLHPAKGYEYLVGAVSRIVTQHPQAHFVIAGETKPRLLAALQEQAAKAGVAQRISFIGFVEDSAAFLSQLDLFLLTSVSEGFSIATVEAMASALPVIATRCGGPEEIVTDRQNALLIEPASADAIIAAVLEVLASPALANRLALAARDFAKTHFSTQAMLDKYIKLYESCA
jgi:glycosyltransferase involved in cell wall biosynthesis